MNLVQRHDMVENEAGSSELVPSGANKVSCLACRAAKRKCLTPDSQTTCKRCRVHHIECLYKKHQRGRVKRRLEGETVEQGPVTTRLRLESENGSSAQLGMALGDAELDETSALSVKPRSTSILRAEQPMVDLAGPAAGPSKSAGGMVTGLQFSHLVPLGDSSPYLPGRESRLSSETSRPTLEQMLRVDCPDPVRAGILTESDTSLLFDFYFAHLNITVPILDPILHTSQSLRAKSPLLYTAILTVTSKITHSHAYSNCLLLANKLLGQTMEYGISDIEVVQAILLLAHWKKPDDSSSWRRVGYAVRLALELKLNARTPSKAPEGESHARGQLNRERTWMNLIIADYHLAIHHTLPRMISEEGFDDPADWASPHRGSSVIGDAVLAPWIQFSRMCRLYADMLGGMSEDPSNLRMLVWLENDWKRWRMRWLTDRIESLAQPQHASVKLCDAYFRFHIAEYRLLYAAQYRAKGETLNVSEPSELSLAFLETVNGSLGVSQVFQNDFAEQEILPYAFNLLWVATAVTSVWLIKNIGAMDPTDRLRVIQAVQNVTAATAAASRSSDDMAAYSHKLHQHLLTTVPPELQTTESDPPQTAQVPSSDNVFPSWSPNPAQQSFAESGMWNTSTDDFANVGMYPVHSGNPTQAFNPTSTSDLSQFENFFPAADDDIWKLLFPSGPSDGNVPTSSNVALFGSFL